MTQSELLPSGLSGRYQMVRRLGAGGMGAVFLAQQVNLGHRPVAIKVLHHRLLEDPEFLQRFQDEAASTARICHQNVVTVYESGQADDGSPYIAMEFLEGETLRQTLQRRGALPLSACAEILQQVARGLNAAHKIGIIHRDLKPDNVFLTHDGEGKPLAKIVDFGIAKMRESSTHTMTGLTVGTPAYMSVEQASGMRSGDLDGRSDIYSLGIVAYEMVTGRVPFQADTPLACIRKHLSEAPPPPRSIRPDLAIPATVEAVIMKALAKHREERYGSATEFAVEVAAAIKLTAPIPPEMPIVNAATLRRAERPALASSKLGKRIMLVVCLVSVLLSGAVVGWRAFNTHPTESKVAGSPANAPQRAPGITGPQPAPNFSARQPAPELAARQPTPRLNAPQTSQPSTGRPDAQAQALPMEPMDLAPTAAERAALGDSGSQPEAQNGTGSGDANGPAPRRVRFHPGQSSVTLEGSVALGTPYRYLLSARAGQLITANVSSANGNAVFAVKMPDGQYLRRTTDDNPGTEWSARVPGSGDLVIEVSAIRDHSKYVLNVAIE